MDKKEIYEHLAEIYLDASLKKKKKTEKYALFKNPFFIIGIVISIVITCVFTVFLFNIFKSNQFINLDSEFALILQPEKVKINFHFNPTKKEAYSINLNKIDLAKYKALAFSARKVNYPAGNIVLKVEFTSTFEEKSAIYLANIPAKKWQDYKIDLVDFKDISNWSEIARLSFIIEEWNVQEKKGVIYIDNIRFLQ